MNLGSIAKRLFNILAVLMILAGAVWFFQGIGVLPGSYMSGQLQWAVNGLIAITLGGAALFLVNRRRGKQG